MPSRQDDAIRIPELLAPAGSREALVAAIAAGADAVYLGGEQFGARKYAGNFTREGISEAIGYAHLRGVRVYVTVNTLIHDKELPLVAEYLVWLYGQGADAVLVQDAGVAALARKLVPGLPLHASTQMTIYDRAGVAMAAQEGFSRVVIAREVPLTEISGICQDPAHIGTGIEVFVHGALCYCYSGQCLLSSVIGGRSGNRGTCAQPCRKPYHLVAGEADRYGRPQTIAERPLRDRYLLSTRDLCLYPCLDRIARCGIAALKIEGRMRSPVYVAIVVSIYRQALDAIAAGTWTPSVQDEQDLLLAFNRGFTRGYISGARPKDVMGRDRQDNRGILIGTVDSCNHARGTCRVRLCGTLCLEQGDGIVVIDRAGGREDGVILTSVPPREGQSVIIPARRRFAPGSEVYLTRSSRLLRSGESIRNKERKTGFIPVAFRFRTTHDHVPVIDMVTRGKEGTVLQLEWQADMPLIPAESAPLTPEHIEGQLRRSGNSPFFVTECRIEYPGGLFAPVSALNRLRRAALSAAEDAIIRSWQPLPDDNRRAQERLSHYPVEHTGLPALERTATGGTEPLILAVYVDHLDAAREAVRNGAGLVCFDPDTGIPGFGTGDVSQHGPAEDDVFLTMMKDFADTCRREDTIPAWKWPPVVRGTFLARVIPLIPAIYSLGVAAVVLENPAHARIILNVEPRICLFGGAGLNIFNHYAAEARSPPFHWLTLSPELSAENIRELMIRITGPDRIRIACIVQGNLEVMVSADDLAGNLMRGEHDRYSFTGIRDDRDRIFPVIRDVTGHTRIRNAVETCLIDHLPDLITADIDCMVIDARSRGARYAGEMTNLYRQALQAHDDGRWNRMIPEIKKKVQERALGGITGGAYTRGLREDLPGARKTDMDPTDNQLTTGPGAGDDGHRHQGLL